jgi:hypothetical protein
MTCRGQLDIHLETVGGSLAPSLRGCPRYWSAAATSRCATTINCNPSASWQHRCCFTSEAKAEGTLSTMVQLSSENTICFFGTIKTCSELAQTMHVGGRNYQHAVCSDHANIFIAATGLSRNHSCCVERNRHSCSASAGHGVHVTAALRVSDSRHAASNADKVFTHCNMHV